MLGPRQQQIIEALADGKPCSLAALEHQVGASREQLRGSLKRLQDAGLIRMVGKRGKHGLDGTMVELMQEPLARLLWPRSSAILRPERTR